MPLSPSLVATTEISADVRSTRTRLMRTTPVCSQISCWMPGSTVSTKLRVGAATAVPAAVAINSRATRTRGAYRARYIRNTRMDHRSLQRRCAPNTVARTCLQWVGFSPSGGTMAKAVAKKSAKKQPAKKTAPKTARKVQAAGWIDAGKGYELGIRDGKLVARKDGKQLGSVPKPVKDGALGERLPPPPRRSPRHRRATP